MQEEISQGAGRMAGHLGLDNLIMFFDANEIQLSTPTANVISEDTAMKYRAWNWNVLEIDGNDPEQIREALRAANEEDARPTLIIGHTVMVRDAVKPMVLVTSATAAPTEHLSVAMLTYNTVRNLGADPENPS